MTAHHYACIRGTPMKSLTIRNVPDDLYDRLTAMARSNRRSLQQQVMVLLEQVRWRHGRGPLDTARALRAELSDCDLGDTVADLREDRAR